MTVRMRVRMMKLLVLPLFDSSASVTPCACVPTPASRAQGPSLQQGPPSGPPTPRGLTQFATFEFNQSDQRALSVCKSSSPGRASACTPPPLDTPPPATPLAPPTQHALPGTESQPCQGSRLSPKLGELAAGGEVIHENRDENHDGATEERGHKDVEPLQILHLAPPCEVND